MPNSTPPTRRAARVLLAAAALAGPALFASRTGAQVTTPPDTTRPAADGARPLVVRDTGRAAAADSAQLARRIKPRDAFLRSLVLPGWGQSSIGAPGRGAVYFALETSSLWMVYTTDRKLDEAREREAVLIETGELEEGQSSGLVRARKAQREDWITLSVFWLFFSGADAFVAAHLRDFDTHVGAGPGPEGGLQLQATLPVGP
jgi:hypothetical protein